MYYVPLISTCQSCSPKFHIWVLSFTEYQIWVFCSLDLHIISEIVSLSSHVNAMFFWAHISMPCSLDLHIHTYRVLMFTHQSCSPDHHIISEMFSWSPHVNAIFSLSSYQYHVLLTSTYVSWSPQIHICIKFSWSLYLNVMFWSPKSVYSLVMSTLDIWLSCFTDLHTSISYSSDLHMCIMFFSYICIMFSWTHQLRARLVWADLHTPMSHDCYTWFSTFMNITDIQCTLFV